MSRPAVLPSAAALLTWVKTPLGLAACVVLVCFLGTLVSFTWRVWTANMGSLTLYNHVFLYTPTQFVKGLSMRLYMYSRVVALTSALPVKTRLTPLCEEETKTKG